MFKRVREVSIDLGNIALKGAMIKDDGNVVLKTIPNKISTDKRMMNFDAVKLEVNGKLLFVGAGRLNNNSKKYDRDYLHEQALVMISELLDEAKTNDEEIDYIVVDLKLGLPPKQYFSDAALKAFKEKFTVGESIECRIRDKYKKIKINSLKVFMEGYSAFKAIEAQGYLNGSTRRLISLDIGGDTTDTCDYEFSTQRARYNPNLPDTIEIGIVTLSQLIANEINDRNEDEITADQVEYAIRNDFKLIEGIYNIDDYMKKADDLKKDLIKQIKDKYNLVNFKSVAILGTGGGFNTFYKLIKEDIVNVIEVPEELKVYGNAIGYLCQ